MRVIVIGLGEVGRHVARTLSAERHDVIVVERDEARVEAAQGDLDAMVVAGNGASPKFLRELGAPHVDLVCAVTQSDEANVIAALTARQLGAGRTVARVRDPDYFGSEESFAQDVLGIDFVIHPERATADDLAEAILLPGAVHVEHFADGRVSIAEVALSPRSPLCGRSLAERRPDSRYAVVAVIRDGRTVAADPGHRPKAGDHVIIASGHEHIADAVHQVAGHVTRVRDVIVFGGGRVGLPLVRRLEAVGDVGVTIMEPDADRARYVAERVRRATVLHEGSSSRETLLAHGADRAGAFVGATGDDRLNLLASLNAKRLGTMLALAVVSREEYTPLVDALGLDAGFSPRLVTAEAILRAVRGAGLESVHLLMGGAEILEVEVDDGCRGERRRVADIPGLTGTRAALIVRDDRVLIPEPDERVRGGDRLLTFSARPNARDVIATFKKR